MLSRKSFLLLTFVLLTVQILFGQTGRLEGQITEAKTGKPLIGVNIYFVGTKFGCATVSGGNYIMLKIPSGSYNLKANYLGYKSVLVQSVEIKSGQTTELNLALQPSHNYELDAKIEALYRKNLPAKVIRQLNNIKEKDKAKYQRLLQEYYFDNLLRINEKNEESNKRESKILELNIKAEELAIKYHSASVNNRVKIKKELKDTLKELFNKKKKQRMDDVKYLKEKLDTLEESLKSYENNIDKLIDKKMDEMLKKNNN